MTAKRRIVFCKAGPLRYFIRKAEKSKSEVFAYLFGKGCKDGSIQVKQFFYPNQKGTPTNVYLKDDALIDAVFKAADERLDVVGTIHSHPSPGLPIMSVLDYEAAIDQGERVSAIVGIVEGYAPSVIFWDLYSALPCQLKRLK